MGRVGCGYLLDQFFAPRVAALLFSAVAIGITFLGLGHAIWSACTAAVLVGLGIGAEVDIIAYLTSRYFGLRSYGAILGWIWAVFGVSGGLGAYLMGFGFDKTGSYCSLTLRPRLRSSPDWESTSKMPKRIGGDTPLTSSISGSHERTISLVRCDQRQPIQ
jgi:MFS family permease